MSSTYLRKVGMDMLCSSYSSDKKRCLRVQAEVCVLRFTRQTVLRGPKSRSWKTQRWSQACETMWDMRNLNLVTGMLRTIQLDYEPSLDTQTLMLMPEHKLLVQVRARVSLIPQTTCNSVTNHWILGSSCFSPLSARIMEKPSF